MKMRIRSKDQILQGVKKMNKKSILAIMLSLCFVFGFMAVSAYGDILTVPDPTHVPPINTIQDAVNAANPLGGDIIMVMPGSYAGALVNKPVEIIGSGTDQTFITSPTSGRSGLSILESNVKISNLKIICNVVSGNPMLYGVIINPNLNTTVNPPRTNVTVTQIEIVKGTGWPITLQGITTLSYVEGILGNNVSECEITHNKVYDFQSDGIFLKAAGFKSEKNLIAFNHVSSTIPSGYFYPVGITLFALGGSRFGTVIIPAGEISNNKVVHNNSTATAGDGIDLAENYTPYTLTYGNITNNYIGFNDCRGTGFDQIAAYATGGPNDSAEKAAILAKNYFSRNLGDNRAVVKTDLPAKDFNPQPIE